MAKKLLRLYNTLDEYKSEKCTIEVKTVSALLDQPKGKNIKIKNNSYFTAVYLPTSTSATTQIFSNMFDITQVSKMYIDDVEITPTSAYTFSTITEHTVKCTFDCGKLTNCNYMFMDSKDLISADLLHLDTEDNVGMRSMFNRCYGLKKINISNLNTSNVTDMRLYV